MRFRNYIKVLSAFAFATALSTATSANAAVVTYVSKATGAADTGTCTVNAPCLTLTYALTQTSPAGTVLIVGPGIYEPVTVSQFVAIYAEAGVAAYIYSTSTTPAVTVNLANTDDFKLINVSVIAGGGTNSTVGVQINSARRIEISGGSIRGFTSNAINIAPSSGILDFHMREMTLSGNNSHCLLAKPTGSGSVRMMIRSSRIDHCGGAGIRADGLGTTGVASGTSVVNGSIIDSVIFAITSSGVAAVSGASDPTNGNVSLQIKESTIQNAATGVTTTGPNAFIHLKAASIFNTSTAVNSTNSTVFSYADSLINANGSPGTATVQIQPR